MFVALAVTCIGQFGAWPTLNGFATELFPTSLPTGCEADNLSSDCEDRQHSCGATRWGGADVRALREDTSPSRAAVHRDDSTRRDRPGRP